MTVATPMIVQMEVIDVGVDTFDILGTKGTVGKHFMSKRQEEETL